MNKLDKEIKIVASDVDGTIFKDNKISEKDLKTIQLLKEQGVKFFISTGRLPSSIESILNKYDIQCGLSTMNGSYVYDGDTIIWKVSIDLQTSFKIQSYLMEEDIYFQIYDSKRSHLSRLPLEIYREEIQKYRTHPEKDSIISFDHDSYFSKDPVKSIIELDNAPYKIYVLPYGRYEDVMSYLTKFSTITVSSSTKTNIEINSSCTNKFVALEEVCKYYGYTTDNLLCIGDYWNDYEMVKNAGIGVAMGNAIAELKEISDYVTDTIDNDGFTKAMQKFVLK